MTTPSEDEITKEQLWQRIDDARRAGSVEVKDVNSRIDQLSAKLRQEMEKQLDDIRSMTEKALVKGLNDIATQAQRLTVLHEKLAKQNQAKQQESLALMDRLGESLERTVGTQVKKETNLGLSSMKASIASLKSSFNKNSKDVDQSVILHHNAMGEGLASVQRRLDDVERRLTKLYGDLKL